MNRQEAFQFLRNNPVFWSRLGFGYDPPIKNEQGKPLVFTEDLDRYGRTHRMFSAAGVKSKPAFSTPVGWVSMRTITP